MIGRVPANHVEATLRVRRKEEGRYAVALKIIVEILTEIVSLILAKIQVLVDKMQNVKQMVLVPSVDAQEDGLAIQQQEVDVRIIPATIIRVEPTLTAKVIEEMPFAHAGRITKEMLIPNVS